MVYFDEDQIEKWVTINGARTPILKDGSVGFSHSINADSDKKEKQIAETKEIQQKLNKSQSSDKLKVVLKQEESDIKDNGYETGICINDNGDIIFRQKGTRDFVEFTEEQLDQLSGNTLTHNHPKNTCFSSDDLYVFEAYSLKELRAVGGEKTWISIGKSNIGCSISRTNKQWTRHPSYLSSDYAEAINKYASTVIDKFYAESEYDDVETIRRANRMQDDFARRWLRENAVNYGFSYKEFRV